MREDGGCGPDMEDHASSEPDQLLQFLRRLKEVFDVCDEDADGFIRVEHLLDLGLQFGQPDEVGVGYRDGWGPFLGAGGVRVTRSSRPQVFA